MNMGKESEKLEFKKSTGELRDAMDDVASILNKSGEGILYFGVKPNGDVCGQEVSSSLLNDVATFIKNAIKPMIYPIITEEILDGKHLIKVEFKGTERPYSSYGRYYKRVFNRAEEMTPDELKHVMLSTDFQSIWENNETIFNIDNIDKEALKRFYNKAVECGRLSPLEKYDEKDLLISLGLMSNDKLTNAGYFLFSKDEPVVLKMAVYATDERINFLDINRVRGNIFNLMDVGIRYISEHINWKVEFEKNSSSRIEIPEVPIEAIREIVVNAFAHANYRSITEHEIAITPSVIDIYNPGEFPLNYNPEDFVDMRIGSMPRNKKILDVLYRSKNVEIQGTGLRKTLNLCYNKNINYSYYNNEYGFKFSFHRKNGTSNGTLNGTLKLSKVDQLVLDELKLDSTLTRENLSSISGKSVRTIQRSIDKLKYLNMLTRVGGKNNGSWKVIG